jgi:CRP/FNR family transcriptional regulator
MKVKKANSNSRSNSYPSGCHYQAGKEINSFYENDIFKGLKPEELALLFERMEVRAFPEGSLIFMPEDSSCENLYLLNQGQVEMYRLTAGGKRLVTRHISPGGVFGVRGLFGRDMQKNFAEAKEDSTIGVITREQVLEYLQYHPDLMLRILENVCSRLYLLEERLVEAVYNPVMVRLAYFLLTNTDNKSGILTDVTHEEIGNRIGAVRQTVTENLSLLRKQGLIQTKPRMIRIIDRCRLEDVIRGKDD